MEQDQMIFEAEKFAPNLLNRPVGFSNLYLIARSFDSFLESVYRDAQ
jgi:hypothetical protein